MPTVMDRRRRYPSDLNDQQWEVIKEMVPTARKGGRPRTTNIRDVLDGILYLVRSGCAWHLLPKDFPPWKTVYHYFRRWSVCGVWQMIHNALRSEIRKAQGRNEFASYMIIDSQSVKAHYGELRGYDGFKKVRGRKRQILVDTLGLLHAVYIHPAHLSDTKEGINVVARLSPSQLDTLRVMHADLGYRGSFEDYYFYKTRKNPLIHRKDEYTGAGKKKSYAEKQLRLKSRMRLLGEPKRWIVERTFAWFNNYRRLNRDFEKRVCHSESMIYLAMMQLMLRRAYP